MPRHTRKPATIGRQFEDRVRFGWGFHDAVNECKAKMRRDVSNHFDTVYAEGYERGREAFNVRGDDGKDYFSDSAWSQREDSRKADATRRRALRNARPDSRGLRV